MFRKLTVQNIDTLPISSAPFRLFQIHVNVRKNSSHSTVFFFFLVNEFTEFVFRLHRQLIYPEVAIIEGYSRNSIP